MKLWIDADALPNDLKDLVLRAAERLKLETHFVANKPIRLPPSPLLRGVVVPHGVDVADAYIVTNAEAGDVCVTQDIPLASELVKKGVVAIDPRGDLHTEATIGERLAMRNLMTDLRDSRQIGGGGGPKPFDHRDRQRFASTLDRVLTEKLRKA